MTDLAYHKVHSETVTVPEGCPVDPEFSPYADKYVADPYAWLNAKRESEPVFYAEELGYVVVTRMDDVHEIFMNPEVFT